MRVELYDHFESCSAAGQGHRGGRHCAEPSVDSGSHGAGIQRRKKRQRAFWEDRYHATAIESDRHLQRCLVYIDLNMIRAGAVDDPGKWRHGGYYEIHQPRRRYGVIDVEVLSELCGFSQAGDFRRAHQQ